MEIDVTYLCWGCGSQKTVKEEVSLSLPLPFIQRWNVCDDCKLKKDKKDVKPQDDKKV